MNDKKSNQNSDDDLFKSALSDVKPLPEINRVELRPTPPPPKVRFQDSNEPESAPDILSDYGEMEEVTAESVLSYCRSGIQNRLFRRLRQGKLEISEEIDLHGLTIKQAKQVFLDFIQLAYPIEGCCICIVHGKSNRSQNGKMPLMKQHVNHWLLQHPRVLAFHSAQPRDGGSGSVYALIRRER
ncbi:DNA mismatch repair protein MutS [Leucothrix sargassi]|nr:DNA mismatch repair protein MutS [Leucothrix sargassi]